MANGLNETTGHPADGREQLADGQGREAKTAGLGGLESMLALAGGATFQLVIHLVADSASFLNRLLHRKDKAWDGLVG